MCLCCLAVGWGSPSGPALPRPSPPAGRGGLCGFARLGRRSFAKGAGFDLPDGVAAIYWDGGSGYEVGGF